MTKDKSPASKAMPANKFFDSLHKENEKVDELAQKQKELKQKHLKSTR